MLAAASYVARDVRDRDGLTRPMLRRAALRMALCRQEPLRRMGSAYLRADPPAHDELPARTAAAGLPQAGPPVSPDAAGGQTFDIVPTAVAEDDASGTRPV